MILKDVRTHRLDYSLLALIAALFTAYFVLSRHSPRQLFLSTVAFAALYALWGVWHHARGNHLTVKVVLEYLLVAALGIAIVSTLLI